MLQLFPLGMSLPVCNQSRQKLPSSRHTTKFKSAWQRLAILLVNRAERHETAREKKENETDCNSLLPNALPGLVMIVSPSRPQESVDAVVPNVSDL